jgi:hypothetical protein
MLIKYQLVVYSHLTDKENWAVHHRSARAQKKFIVCRTSEPKLLVPQWNSRYVDDILGAFLSIRCCVYSVQHNSVRVCLTCVYQTFNIEFRLDHWIFWFAEQIRYLLWDYKKKNKYSVCLFVKGKRYSTPALILRRLKVGQIYIYQPRRIVNCRNMSCVLLYS